MAPTRHPSTAHRLVAAARRSDPAHFRCETSREGYGSAPDSFARQPVAVLVPSSRRLSRARRMRRVQSEELRITVIHNRTPYLALDVCHHDSLDVGRRAAKIRASDRQLHNILIASIYCIPRLIDRLTNRGVSSQWSLPWTERLHCGIGTQLCRVEKRRRRWTAIGSSTQSL